MARFDFRNGPFRRRSNTRPQERPQFGTVMPPEQAQVVPYTGAPPAQNIEVRPESVSKVIPATYGC